MQKVQRFEDTAANWAANNPRLPANWEAVESDTGKEKKADGVNLYNDLAYSATGGGGGSETAASIGVLINGSSAAVPNNTDLVATASSSVLKKITWTNVKIFLKAYFDTLYPSGSGTSTGTNTGDQVISDATLSTSDITTNNFSTAKHGFVPKGPNLGKFLKDDGSWATIPGGGDLLAANNLSDLASAATARTNLGVEIGLDVQQYAAALDAASSIPASDGIFAYSAGSAFYHTYAATKVLLGLDNVDNTSDGVKNGAAAALTNKTINLASNTISGTKAQFDTACSDDDFVGSSALDTDTTLAANSDSKIATQKAVKAYVDAGGLTSNTQSGTTYSLVATDKGKEVRTTNAAAKTVTIDPTATLGTDFIGVVANLGAGALTLAPGSGVTLRKNIWKIGQYKRVIITAIGTDEYLIDADKPDPITTLTDGANIATDCALGQRFRVTLGGNRTLDNPTNPQDGFQYVWEFLQDATGSRTITLGSKFAFGSDITALTLTTTASKRDFVTAIYNSTADKFYIVGVSKGY